MKSEPGRIPDTARREVGGQRLRRAKADSDAMSGANPVAAVVTDLDGERVLRVNDAFVSFSGWDREGVVGSSVHESGWWDELETWSRMVHELRTRESVSGIEATFRTRSGLRREAFVSAQVVELDDGPGLLVYFLDVTERNRLRRRLDHITLHDPLTGLPNRVLFRRRLAEVVERAGSTGPLVGVLLLDLDRFKVVNDALGHAAGDELLRSVADRIRGCFGEHDLAARFGGDEFAVVMERNQESEIRTAADRLARALGSPFEVAGIQVRLSTSTGIAVSPPLPRERAEDMVRFADIALQKARAVKGTMVEAFEPGRDEGATESLHRENELWTALARDELILLYQPIVALSDERITGCEALIRWDHPERGLVPPGEFIPLAEESGLIFRMGTRVLERACRDPLDWGLRARDGFVVSVNLSPRQFHEPEFVENLTARLSHTDFPPNRLQLEITESALMRTLGNLERLRDLGVRIAIDDFGTGFSSIQYLRELDVDALKIDAAFTSGIGVSHRDEHIIRAIVLFAHGLGVQVVAEGVETSDQHAFLRDVDCDFAQGYLYSEPVPASEFGELLAREGRLSQSG